MSPIERRNDKQWVYLVHHFVHFSATEDVLQYFGAQVAAPRPTQWLAELGISLALAAVSWCYIESDHRMGRACDIAQTPRIYHSGSPNADRGKSFLSR
jgi:hypothetical protein